jgi:6-phosphogluconolactonase
MTARSKFVISLLGALSAVSACQSSDAEPEGGAGSASVGIGGTVAASAGDGGHVARGGGGSILSAGNNAGGATAAGGENAGLGGELDNQAGFAGEAIGGTGAGAGTGTTEAGEGGGAGVAESPRAVAYVATILNGISASSVDPVSGAPLLLTASPIDKTAFVAAIAVGASQRFVYVADENKHIDTYRIAANGDLPAQASSSVPTPDTLNTLALDPKGRFAYAGSSPGKAIYVFSIDADSGALSAVGDPVSFGKDADHGGAAYVATDPSGNFVYVSQAFELGIRGFRIDQASGALKELPDSPFAAQTPPNGHDLFGGAIVFKPSGDFAYSSGGALHAFSVDPTSGKLTLLLGSPFSLDVQSDANIANIAVDPQGDYLYATHFLGDEHISGFAIDSSTGALEEVPGSPITGSAPFSLAVDPSGRFVYVGIDGPGGLAVFSVKRATGALTRLDQSPFPIGGPEPKVTFATLAPLLP